MPNWNAVLAEIDQETRRAPIDQIRRNYLNQLHEHTGRNVIAYYSGFMQKKSPEAAALGAVNDDDKNGFMSVIHEMNPELGLDLILHTPGGDIAAAESIVAYLRAKFGTNIRAIVPLSAMSAGTMIACSCKEIIMGKQSNLGPFDPQFGGIPAYGVLEEFEKAKAEILADPRAANYWQFIISKYHPTFIGQCEKAIQWAGQIVQAWLESGMFAAEENPNAAAARVVAELNNHTDTFAHARHIHMDKALELGLKIVRLEDDQILQDLVLTVHHAYMHAIGSSNVVKSIENHSGRGMFWNVA
ncbi:SDH family Clp fold serine proteinase [Aeromonas hydrophila]|uniref:SDH family Clp fold serine proteinase n=1 Tax=Aeromonas hydrophila TaxID=644 RepID=UPI003216E062